MYESWAADVLFEFFMVSADSDWAAQSEKVMCAKIVHSSEDLEGQEVIQKNALELFHYRSPSTPEEYTTSMMYTSRTLYQHYDTGEGKNHKNVQAKEMCSGIKSVLGKDGEDPSSVVDTTIHLRQ